MGRKRIEALPAEGAQVRVKLDEWRANRPQGRRIPEEVWSTWLRRGVP